MGNTVKAADVLIEDSEEAIWMMGNVLENEGFMVNAVMTGNGVKPLN